MPVFIDEGMMNDAVINGIANTVIIEAGKRWKQFPLDPNNKNQVKAVSAAVCLALAVANAALTGELSASSWGAVYESALYVLRLWVVGWIISHATYQAAPGLKTEK